MPEISLWPDPSIVKRAFLGEGLFLRGWRHCARTGFMGAEHILKSADKMTWRSGYTLFFGETKP
jgi:hypothetical protein